jgi:hypothetical protein
VTERDVTPPDDWSFGRGGFAKLYGNRLAQSSLLDRDVASRWVFVFMLSQADAQGRYRCASVAGLARASAVTLEQAETAVRELEAPDPDSTTRDAEGRRIVRIPGGWQIVTFQRYREYRSAAQLQAAERQRRHRAAERDMSQPSRPVTHQKTEDRRQKTENGHHPLPPPAEGAPATVRASKKGNGAATARELAALEAEPEVASVGDAWARAFGRKGRQLGVLRAVRTALAAGYASEVLRLVARVVAEACRAPERFPERGSIRWAVEHGKAGDPGYVLRPSTLDRLIPEAEAWEAQVAPSPRPADPEPLGPVFSPSRDELAARRVR